MLELNFSDNFNQRRGTSYKATTNSAETEMKPHRINKQQTADASQSNYDEEDIKQ